MFKQNVYPDNFNDSGYYERDYDSSRVYRASSFPSSSGSVDEKSSPPVSRERLHATFDIFLFLFKIGSLESV